MALLLLLHMRAYYRPAAGASNAGFLLCSSPPVPSAPRAPLQVVHQLAGLEQKIGAMSTEIDAAKGEIEYLKGGSRSLEDDVSQPNGWDNGS